MQRILKGLGNVTPEYSWLVGDRVQLDVDKDRFSWGERVRRVNAVLVDRVHCLEGLGVVLQHFMIVPELPC